MPQTVPRGSVGNWADLGIRYYVDGGVVIVFIFEKGLANEPASRMDSLASDYNDSTAVVAA